MRTGTKAIALGLGVLIGIAGTEAYHMRPRPVVSTTTQPVVNQTIVKTQRPRATLDDVRRDWGIQGPLVCHVGPYQPK